MTTTVNVPKTLTQTSYDKHYRKGSFLSFWAVSVVKTKSLVRIAASFLLGAAAGSATTMLPAVALKPLASSVLQLQSTISLTVLGLLLVSFSLLVTLSDRSDAFWRYTDDRNEYNAPFVKAVALHFVFPVGVFFAMLLIAGAVQIVFAVPILPKALAPVRQIAYAAYLGLSAFLFTLGALELAAYFWNIYRFVTVNMQRMSQSYEDELIERSILGKDPPSLREKPDLDRIREHLEAQRRQDEV